MDEAKCHGRPRHDEIALCAFLSWEAEGRQPGRELNYWLRAERQLRATRQIEAAIESDSAAQAWPPLRIESTVRITPRRTARNAALKPAARGKPVAVRKSTAPVARHKQAQPQAVMLPANFG